ncbi:MAG: 50S ribosomal protein L24 [Patescibacteria group bacterium]
MKIHLDDKVIVVAGKYRGKTGNVVRVNAKSGKVVVEKINIRTKHIKKTPNQPGQKIHFEAPFDISNVMVICPHCEKKTRVAYIRLNDGKRQRVCKKCKQSLDKIVERKKTKKR